MYLRELVGKKVLRTKPVGTDNSYCSMISYMITVVDIINDIPIIKIEDRCLGTRVYGIDDKFNDDNWKEVTEVWDCIDKLNKEIQARESDFTKCSNIEDKLINYIKELKSDIKELEDKVIYYEENNKHQMVLEYNNKIKIVKAVIDDLNEILN